MAICKCRDRFSQNGQKLLLMLNEGVETGFFCKSGNIKFQSTIHHIGGYMIEKYHQAKNIPIIFLTSSFILLIIYSSKIY